MQAVSGSDASGPNRGPDWISWGGWHPSAVRILVETAHDRFAFALIDTNGDGRELSAAFPAREGTGAWREFASDGDAAEVGEWWSPDFVCAWGQGAPRG